MFTFEKSSAWQKSMDLAEQVLKLTDKFPSTERFELVSQMRRAAASIPSNIAEGYGKRTKRDFLKFMSIARGSTYELYTQLNLSQRVGFLDSVQQQNDLIEHIAFELNRIISKTEGDK